MEKPRHIETNHQSCIYYPLDPAPAVYQENHMCIPKRKVSNFSPTQVALTNRNKLLENIGLGKWL